jgi:N12 class adenine-specific DNA methylase/predicted RNA methylase
MPLVIGLGRDDSWKDPLNLYGGKAPEAPKTSEASASTRPSFSDADRSDLVNTVIAEAAGEGDAGMADVASVIRNRSSERGISPGDVVRQKRQFTGYEAPGEAAKRAQQDPVLRQRAEAIIDGVFSGALPDETGGADHYHADSVMPDWASSMQETTKRGRHVFYKSGQPGQSKPSAKTAFAPGLDGSVVDPFEAILNPKKAEQPKDGSADSSMLLSKLQPGKPAEYVSNMKPGLQSGLTAMFNDAPDFVKSGLDILSGARSPERQAQIIAENAGKYGIDRKAWLADVDAMGPVEAGQKWKPIFKQTGMSANIGAPGGSRHQHGDAADLGWNGGEFSSAPKEVVDWVHANAGKYGMRFPLKNENWHIETADARDGHDAEAPSSPKSEAPTIVANAHFAVKDPMGLYPEGNPIQQTVDTQVAAADQRQADASAQAEQNRMGAFTEQHNVGVTDRQQQLEAENPGRYVAIDESELPNWQKQWEADNRSGGIGGDTARILKSGTIGVGQSLSSLADTLFRKLPGGDDFLKASDDIDRWVMGKTIDQKMADSQQRANASVTERQQDADAKNWWDDKKHTFGPAWRDPRSYLRTVGESAPGTVVTMLPGGVLARGAYLRALAAGATERAAAATAARTATLAGAITEGTMGGADSARNVRDKIGKLPREQLAKTEAVRAMVQGGMSEDEAIKALSEDAASQAFLTAGVATGMFGGMGDRALAKIIAEGVGGGIVKRIVAGATRGFVGEGLLEEAPQGAAQTIAENAAVQKADPNQSLTEGVGEAVASGVAAGGAMGAGMGGAGGAFRPASPEHSAAAPAVAAPAPEAAPQPKGPIGRSVQHAEEQIAGRQQQRLADDTMPDWLLDLGRSGKTANDHIDGLLKTASADIEREQANRPSVGATVRVDHEGIDPFMARVDSYEGDEAVVIDGGSGEVYQVPIASISQIAKSPEQLNRENPIEKGPVPINDSIPEFSKDPALEPQAPVASEIKSEPLPAQKDMQAATERLRGRPSPGQRVIVDDARVGRFAAKVESYEEGDTETVVTTDDGEVLQVPVDRLYVDKLTPKQIEKQDLERNPPIEREIGDAGPNSRKVIGKTVVLPDENHAALFDLAKSRFIAKKLGREAHTDLERVSAAEVKRLADAFNVSPTAITSMADDYRYRVDRAAKEARSTLPVHMHPVNDTRLRQWQRDRKNEESAASAAPETTEQGDSFADWWDLTLDDLGRKRVLAETGIKRSEKSKWAGFTPAIRKKLEAVRTPETPKTTPADVTAVPDMPAGVVSRFTTAKGSVYEVHQDGTTVRTKAARNDPGHEGDSGLKPRTAKTVYVDANASVLSTAGMSGIGSKGSRVIIKDGKASLLTWNEAQNRWGVMPDGRDVPVHDQPAVGRFPLELWQPASDVNGYEAYSRMHAGNAITEMSASAVQGQRTDGADDSSAHEAATSPKNDLPEPTQAQKEAGNYKVGRLKLGGLDISVENPEGSERKGTDASGKPWSVKMKSHYGYIRGTIGRDKDHIDTFVRPGVSELDDSAPVFVVDQKSENGRFDEHKVMLGFDTEEAARKAYLENYTAGWKGLGDISATTMDDFKQWLKSGKTDQPFAPKWFGSREKADAYIAKQSLGSSHEVVENGKRFEVREKPAAPTREEQAPQQERAQSGPPQIVSADAPEIDLWRGASKAEIAAIKAGEYEFRPTHKGIMFTTDRRTAESYGGTTGNETLAIKIPTSAKILDRKSLSDRPPAFDEVLNASGKRPGFDMDQRQAFFREEARERGYDVLTYASGTGTYQVYEILNPDIIQIVDQATPAAQPKSKPAVSVNKIFTLDAAEKARALLRKKLNQINSGIDPELMQAGITLAGYHIERGARTFAAYANAMLVDLGEAARPYLKSWYMGVKYDPRASAFADMSSATEVDGIDVATITGDESEPAELDRAGSPALEGTPADEVPGAESSRETRPGADGRGRADVSRDKPARGERVQSGRGVADEQGELSLAAGRDRDTRSEKRTDASDGESRSKRPAVDENLEQGPFGPILRGYEGKWREAALELERRQTGDAIGALSHPDVGPIDLVWGNAGTNASNGAGLAKLIAWHPEVLGNLQGFIDRLHVDKDRSTTRRIQLSDESGNAGVRLDYDGTAKTWLLTAFENGSRRSEKSSRRLSALWGDRPASAPPRTDENISDQLRDVQSAAVPAQQRAVDYTLSADDNLGEGGQKAKFAGNVAAIRLLRTLDEEKRPATRDEQAVLAKWVGWGGLRQAFAREDGSVAKGWEKQAAELKGLLSPEEYSAAESSTRNAHYTAAEVVSAIWDIARKLGFKGGQVLEPSVGAGNFLGLMPGDVRNAAKVTGVELDRVTGGIAKNLYPSANIQTPMGFEKLSVPDSYFDLAIGNPPFGSEKVYDKDRRHLNKLSIHNFFFAKSVDALRPGGVLAMVVTNRFLDGQSAAARNLIAKQADLVAAIRLPNNAFLKNAGTEVTTDIVILRKRLAGEAPSSSQWLGVSDYRGRDGNVVPLNDYFVAHPEMMLGEFGAFGSMYGPDEPALIARGGQDTPAELAKAIRSLPENIMVEPGHVATETVSVPETVNDVQVGSMFAAPDGTIHQRLSDSIGQAQSAAVAFPNETAKERVSGMVRVRDAFARLRRAQIDEKATDQQIENLRNRLNTLYDGFVKKHGPINADANKRLFRDDPTWPQISALEQGFDKGISATVAKATGEKATPASAQKAAIFSKRTQQPYRRPTSASSAKDALATILNDLGRVDLDAMSRLYGKPSDAIVSELGPLLYKTPSGAYETADAYLSGNVKQKLAEAERAAEQDSDFRRNINALRDVQPADIEAIDIDVKPGSPWVPAKHIEDFIKHVAQSSVKPKAYYSAANAKWVLDVPSPASAAQTQWGTDRASVDTVLSAVMNGQSITISDRMNDGTTVLNQPATEAANEKAERVKAEWRRWLWDNDARRDELARLYNDTFNTDVMRSFDGGHLTLPGKVGDDIISFRPHQKNFVWRSLQSGTALADHTVGAGKTFAAIASAMEKRRIGQARKPMFVVPNHLVGQWAADFVRLYPGAKVLAATKKDFEKDNRKRLFARVATGDWDAVIVAHSSFGKIGIDPNYESRFIQQQMDDLEQSIGELRRNTGEKSRNVAQLTKWRDNLKAKMERLLDAGKKDDGLTFDELGVDALYVDEAHEFKNLAFATSMNRVAGLGNQAGSQKASDLYMKSRFILEKTGGNNVAFLTGTPLSNTMAEMFTVQRYLDEKALRNLGVAHFDAWARVFGEVVSDWELSPSGQYKLNSRFAKFVNMPELMQRYLSFADVITNDDIKAQLAAIGKKLPLPKVKGGKPTNITVERSPDQAAFIGEGKADENGNLEFPKGSLVHRAENLPKKAEKGADNMLKVMSDARKAALDMRLIDPAYSDHPGSKVHVSADNIKRIYDRWSGDRGTQLVFIDLSTPKKARAREEAELRALIQKADEGDEAAQEKLDNMSPDDFLALQSTFSVYDDLREKLISRGIPADEIAFIHDANTEAQKEELFGKVRSGRVRVLLGSTPKMGAGTNVQNRLVALHHLDAPWRPSDLEQRDGRGIRQGNELYGQDPDNFEIEILRYATKNTLDARQWQGIEAKARFIQQVRKGNLKTREIEDIAGEAANAAEMKAAASGNPLILEEMETRRKLRQLEGQSVEHDREQHRIKGKIRSLKQEADEIEARSISVQKDAERAEAIADKPFEATIGGQSFDKPKEFGAAIAAAMRKELIDHAGDTELGKYGDFTLSIEHQYDRAFEVTVSGDRDYQVHVQDAADVDATGLGMRVINTVKKLSTVPQLDRDRATEARGQIPALEKQLGPWKHAEELTDTSARHRRILDALKPKQKGAANAAVAKRPDPVVRGDGRFKEAQAPERGEGESYADWARRIVMENGRSSGHEYLVAIDDDGSTIEFGTAGDPRYTGMSNKLASAMANPDRSLVLYHNHPADTPLSAQDIAATVYPGVHQIYALGHNGYDTVGGMTSAARDYLSASPNITRDSLTFSNNLATISYEVEPYLANLVKERRITEAQAKEAFHHFAAIVANRAGIIDFSTSRPYNPSIVPGLDRKIDEAALKLARAFFKNGKPDPSSPGTNRSSNAVRHVAGMEGLGSVDQQVAGPRSAATGLSEASTPDDSGKVEGRKRVTETRVVKELNGKLIDIQPTLLKTVPLNYFTELARPNMTAVGDYLRVKRLMDAYRGTKHAAADEIAGEWLKYARLGFLGKDKSRAQELANLMHNSTLAGVDPSKTDEETTKKPGYELLRKQYMAMPEKGRQLYRSVRDAYKKQALELDDILLDNVRKAQQIAHDRAEARYRKTMEKIRDSGLTGIDRRNAEEDAASAHKAETTKATWAAKARLTKMRIAFEASRVEEPYFPLGRFGRYFVTQRDIDGRVLSFSKFETAAARDRFAAELSRGAGGAKVEVGVMEAGSDLRKAMDPRIVAEIEEILGGAGVGNDIMDQIWQRYLESMPDLSARKRFIHRQGTAGFTGDALRVFSSHMFHSAHQIARLKYGLELQELTGQAMDQAKESDDQTRGVTLANELSKRHEWVMNPTGSKVAQTMTSTAFVWFLAASPAAAAVNMTQTVMLGLPILSAKFGSFAKAGAALAQASMDTVRGRGSIVNGNLSKDEKAAIKAFYESGLIDRTQSHDLAGVGETGVEYTPLRARVMGVISWAFHRAEVWNREVTALAAYRMARDAGETMSAAIDTAHDLTWKTHFDYANSSRPAVLQNDLAKVALVFRQHNINMLYRLFRDVQQSMKGETAQARKEARYQLAGVVGMMSLMAGVSGTVGFHLLMGLAGMVFGDDDDPMDFETQFKANVIDILGPELGGVVLNGVPGHYLGIDLSSRIGMPDLWFRSPSRDLQGKDEYQYWLTQTLGATAGLGETLYTGGSLIYDGDVARGIEMMAPKAIRDLMKSYRYASEGLATIGGDQVLPADEMGYHDIVAQALGFNPARVAETWDRNTALKNAERRVLDERQRLVNKFAMAAMSQDDGAIDDAVKAIEKFNAAPVHGGVAITKDTLQRSLKTRASNSAKREDGVLIRNKILSLRLRESLADPVYR